MRRITLFSLAVISVLLLASCRSGNEDNSSSSKSLVSTQEVASTSKQSSTKETKTASTTSTSETKEPTVDTRNLTADQMKQWVAAIWLKRTNLDLLQDPKYEIVLEIKEDQLLYARVEAAHAQIDTLDLFRVNSEGDLEEAGYYQSKPDQDWIVVSKNYLDTSLVEPAPAEEASQQ